MTNQGLTVRKKSEFIGVHSRACHTQRNRQHESSTDGCHQARNYRLTTSECDGIIRAKGLIEAIETINQHPTTLVSARLQPR
jgi:hypothetical protein